MPPLKDQDQRSGRHAGGSRRSFHTAGLHWARAAGGGMVVGSATTLAGLISRLLFHRDYPVFHRDYPGGHGFDGFVADVIALVLASVGIALIASFAVVIWKRARHRLGGSPGR